MVEGCSSDGYDNDVGQAMTDYNGGYRYDSGTSVIASYKDVTLN